MAQHDKSRKLHKKRMAYLRGRLLEQRRKLVHALDRGVATYNRLTSAVGDEYDAANDSSEKETMYGVAEIESTRLNEVERALEKIDEGTYGKCERCGGRIPAGRLKVAPFASLCVKCKEEEEHRQSARSDSEAAWSRVQGSSHETSGFDKLIEAISRGE